MSEAMSSVGGGAGSADKLALEVQTTLLRKASDIAGSQVGQIVQSVAANPPHLGGRLDARG